VTGLPRLQLATELTATTRPSNIVDGEIAPGSHGRVKRATQLLATFTRERLQTIEHYLDTQPKSRVPPRERASWPPLLQNAAQDWVRPTLGIEFCAVRPGLGR